MEPTGTSEGAGAPHPRRAHKGATAPRGDALRAPRDPHNPEPLPWASKRGHGRAGRGPGGRGWPGTPPRSLSAPGPRAARLRRAAGPGPCGLGLGPGAPRAPSPPSPPRPAAHGGDRGERGEGRARPAALTPAGGAPSRPPGARYLAAALRVPGLRPRHARLRLLEAPTAAAQSGPAAMSAAPRAALWGRAGGRAPGAGGSPRPGSL